jgi:hypothetical protein
MGSLSGSSTGDSSRAPEEDTCAACGGALHGENLRAFDRDERVVDEALRAAGLPVLLDEHARWSIGSTHLTVSKWLVEETRHFALRIWSGWPLAETPRKSLDPAAVYAYARAGRIFPLSGPERAKQKLRLLVASGVVRAQVPSMMPLPSDATMSEIVVSSGVVELLVVERLCGSRSIGSTIVFSPEFASRWTGLTRAVARDGIRRLRSRSWLELRGTTPIPGSSRRANVYGIRGESG